MACIALVGLLLAHIAGADLGCVADPQLMTQPLHQLLEPQRVTHRLHSHQRRCFQLPVEPLRFPIPMHQLRFHHLPSCSVENRNLLVAGMKITSYNFHKAPLLPATTSVSKQPKSNPGSHWSLSVYSINRSGAEWRNLHSIYLLNKNSGVQRTPLEQFLTLV